VSGELLQFLVRTPVRPRGEIISGGALTDLDGPGGGTCTVTLTLPDGTPGPASGPVGHVATGVYDFALAGPTTPVVYDITWAGQLGGENVAVTTQAEALGEFLFALPDLRDLRVGNGRPFKDSTAWPEERLLEARTATLEEIQRILWYAPVPRYGSAVLSGDGTAALRLPHYEPSKILAASIDGTALSSDELADLYLDDRFVVRKTLSAWPQGAGNVTVAYVHGLPALPGEGSNVAMVMAAMSLDPSAVSGASSMVTPDGTSYDFDPAGQVTRAGQVRHTGVPRVDAWLNRWKVA
jgi:hypothetical protein